MLLVITVWAAYLFLVYEVITQGIQIGDFLNSLLILGITFFILLWWSVWHLGKSNLPLQTAVKRNTDDQDAIAAADSGSVTFRAAGVTFDNEDGTSRQEILQHMKFGDAPWADDPDDLIATLEETEYQGAVAYAVLLNGYQIGFVPKNVIRKVQIAQQHMATCYVSSVRILGGGTAEDGTDLNYGCEITLEY